jgi:hypothetical protein
MVPVLEQCDVDICNGGVYPRDAGRFTLLEVVKREINGAEVTRRVCSSS